MQSKQGEVLCHFGTGHKKTLRSEGYIGCFDWVIHI